MMAFVKILKKFEKITGKEVLSIYLKMVETSYFNSSDEACVLRSCPSHIYTFCAVSLVEYSAALKLTTLLFRPIRCAALHCRR